MAQIATWPGAVVGAACGPLPYLQQYARSTLAQSSVTVVSAAANGISLREVQRTHWPLIRDKCQSLGIKPGVLELWQGEFEGADPASDPASSYQGTLEDFVNEVWQFAPDCLIVVIKLLRPTLVAGDTIRAAQEAVGARYPSRILLVDPRTSGPGGGFITTAEPVDKTHATPGAGGGHDQMQSAVMTAIAAFDAA